ncbi:MAG: hypothetical protein WCJ49_01860, partial [Deltaproteobacteria bacterium]
VFQITSQHDIIDTGIKRYVFNGPFGCGIVLGLLSMFLLLKFKKELSDNFKIQFLKVLANIILYGTMISFAIALNKNIHNDWPIFLLFGSAIY